MARFAGYDCRCLKAERESQDVMLVALRTERELTGESLAECPDALEVRYANSLEVPIGAIKSVSEFRQHKHVIDEVITRWK